RRSVCSPVSRRRGTDPMVTSNVTIQHEGPIDNAVFPLAPGFYYLIGENGEGKSHALRAMSRALGGDDRLVLKRGEAAGFVRGLGRDRSLTQGRTTPGKGELWVFSIQGLDPSKIIHTGHVDPVRADRERI